MAQQTKELELKLQLLRPNFIAQTQPNWKINTN